MAIVEETERAAACGDTRGLYQELKSVSRRCYLNEIEGLSQTKPDGSVDGKITLRNFSIMQYPRTLPFHRRMPLRWKTSFLKLTHPPWRRFALPIDSYATTETLERMASQRRFTRRALTPWAHGCVGLLSKCGCVRLSQIIGVGPFFSLYSRRGTSECAPIMEEFA